ncbi:hypothetical protein RCL1_000363 [Eukaryota sp. TZLM3-RCL]
MRLLVFLALSVLVFAKLDLQDICDLGAVEVPFVTDSLNGVAYLSPCTPVVHKDGCENGLSCIRFSAEHVWYKAASTLDKFYLNKKKTPTLYLSDGERCYASGELRQEYATEITFICNKKLKRGENVVIASHDFPHERCIKYGNTVFSFEWYSSSDFVCARRVGFFGTFFLLLFIGAIVYITVGIVYKGFVQGMTGVELIPNIDFWRDFPNWSREIIRKLYAKVNKRASYSQV